MDGMLPVDYVLANPTSRDNTTLRSLKMLLFVNPDAVSLTIHHTELITEEGSKVLISKQCPSFNWQRLAGTYTKKIVGATAKLLLSAPIAYGHDGCGRCTFGILGREEPVILQQDLVYMSPQSVYTKTSSGSGSSCVLTG